MASTNDLNIHKWDGSKWIEEILELVTGITSANNNSIATTSAITNYVEESMKIDIILLSSTTTITEFNKSYSLSGTGSYTVTLPEATENNKGQRICLFKYGNSSLGNKITVDTTSSQVINTNKTTYTSLQFKFQGEQITLVSHGDHWDVSGEANLFINNITVSDETEFINGIEKLNFLGGGVINIISEILITSNRSVDLTGIRIVADSSTGTQIKFNSDTVRLTVTGTGFYFDAVRFTGVRTSRNGTSQYFLELEYDGVNGGKFEGCTFRNLLTSTRNTTDGNIKLTRTGSGVGYNITFTDCDFFTSGTGNIVGLEFRNTSTAMGFFNVYVFAHRRVTDNFNLFRCAGSTITSSNGNFYTEGTAKVDTNIADNRFYNTYSQMSESLIKLNDEKTSLATSDAFIMLDSVDDTLKYITVENSFDNYLPLTGGIITGNIELQGSQTVNITTVNSSTYSLTTSDYILHTIYTLTGSCTITLPTSQTILGRTIKIKDAGGNASNNNITINTESSETIDNSSTFTINGNYDAIELYCDGINWFIL